MIRKTVLFSAFNSASGGVDFWETDGTDEGTRELAGINDAALAFFPQDMTVFNGKVLFSGHDASGNVGMWVTNGTVAGTHELNISGAFSGGIFSGVSHPDFTTLNGQALFEGKNTSGNLGLWVTDGTAAGTHELSSSSASSSGIFTFGLSNPEFNPQFTSFNGELLLQGAAADIGLSLWETDGTAAGTQVVPLTGLPPNGLGLLPAGFGMVVLKGSLGSPDRLLITGYPSGLGVTDGNGTAAGTYQLGDGVFSSAYDVTAFTAQRTEAIFAAKDGNGHNEVWVTDGTVASEITTSAFGPVSEGQNPYFTPLNDKVLFEGVRLNLRTHSDEASLWVTDGTAAGTHELSGISGASSIGISPYYMTVSNSVVLFNGTDASGNDSLWVTDGTSAGTYELSSDPDLPTDLTPVTLHVPPPNNFSAPNTSVILMPSGLGGNIPYYVWQPDEIDPHSAGSVPLYNEVGTGDFDGDGTADILFRSTVSDDIGFYRVRFGMLQTGNVQSWHDMGSVPHGFSAVGVGDFTVWGTASALLRNNSTGGLGFLESQGYWQQIQDPHSAFDPAFNPAYTVAGVGDFTGDGIDDILFRNNTTGDLGYVQLKGDGTFQGWHSMSAYGVDPAYTVAGIGDFNGEGTGDILFRNNATGKTMFEEMRNGVSLGFHLIGFSDPNFSVLEVGDFDGNDTSDIVLQDSNGKLNYFFNNGVLYGPRSGWQYVTGSLWQPPAPPVVTVSNLTATHGQSFTAAQLFSGTVNIFDSSLQVEFWNTGTGGGHFMFNGVVQGTNQGIIGNLSQLSYQSGSGMDTLWVREGNGVVWGNWSNAFTITAPIDASPSVSSPNRTATHGQSFAAASLFKVTDADGDAMAKYTFWNSGTGGGHFVLGGVMQGSNQEIEVSAVQLPQLSYQSGSGADTLWVRANDGMLWSDWSNAFTVTAPIDHAPVVVGSNVTAGGGQSFAASSLFTASDVDGDPIATYAFWNSGTGGAHFVLNGVAQPISQEIDIAVAQLSQLIYQSGSGGDALWVRANDGILWGNWSTVSAPINNAPVVIASSVTAGHGQSFAASSLFTASDPNGDSITTYAFWNSGTGGGHFLLNGVAQPTSQEIDLTAAQLSQLSYQSGSGADTLWVRANDGMLWGNWSNAFTVTAPKDHAPVVTVSNVAAKHGESFAAASLFKVTDADGDAIAIYAFWNSGTGGGYFMLNGVAQGTNQEIDFTAAQVKQLTYQSGSGADALWVRANDGIQWGNWSDNFTVTAPIDDGPVVTPTNASTHAVANQTFAASSLIGYSDPFNSPATEYDFWNSGGGGGHFLLNGSALPANQDTIISASQLSHLSYQVGTGADTLRARANDGTAWGAWSSSFTISDPPPAIGAGETLTFGSAFADTVSFLSQYRHAQNRGLIELCRDGSRPPGPRCYRLGRY
jgi:ELWxxDGT repeat protein